MTGQNQVGAVVDLEFTPGSQVISDKIGLVQTVKPIKNGQVDVDRGRQDLEQRTQKRRDLDEGRFIDRGATTDITPSNEAIEIEILFDEIVNSPGAFTDLISSHFVNLFKANNDSHGYFQQLAQQYPNYTGALHTAYRKAFNKQKASAAVAEAPNRVATPLTTPEENQAKTTFLTSGPYTKQNHVTSVNKGKFDASYNPNNGILNIKMKLFYDFKDNTQVQPRELVQRGLSPEQAKEYGGLTWTQQLKDDFMNDIEASIIEAWDAKYILTVQKPGWEDITAIPRFQIERVNDPSIAHRKVEVSKAAIQNAQNQTKLRAGGMSAVTDTTALLQQFDSKEKLTDPLVHQYLHTAEANHVENAYLNDRLRITFALGGIPAINFLANSERIDPNDYGVVMQIVNKLKNLSIPSTLAHLHKIVVKASTTPLEPKNLALARAKELQLMLKQMGVQQAIAVDISNGNTATGLLEAGPIDPTVKEKFIDNWSRVSVIHEFGHMLGLTDEYNKIQADELRNQLVNQGMLPPGTDAGHLTGQFETKHREFSNLLQAAGVSAPAFGSSNSQLEGGNQAHSTSIMTGGFEIMKAHYITLWEVLGQMTAPHLNPTDWKIE